MTLTMCAAHSSQSRYESLLGAVTTIQQETETGVLHSRKGEGVEGAWPAGASAGNHCGAKRRL